MEHKAAWCVAGVTHTIPRPPSPCAHPMARAWLLAGRGAVAAICLFVCAVVAQETCRDMGHTQLGVAGMFDAAETAWLQGVNLYQSTPGMAEVRGC